MSDIGPGDVVEAVFPAYVGSFLTGRAEGYRIKVGDRAIVSALTTVGRFSQCDNCGDKSQRGLLLKEYPLREAVAWCFCEWRRVGPTRAELSKRFAEDLRQGERKVLFPHES